MNVFEKLNQKLRSVIRKYGYDKPTIAQEKGIPYILAGFNVLLIAPTGSGKTEAALFPIFNKIIEREIEGGIYALYITPLRALNRDVFRRMVKIASELNINVSIRHGDTPQRIRRLQAIKPPQILITTPETLQAILPGRVLRGHLRNIKWIIIDEIHELASDKRGVQLALALERLREITKREFQRIGLSATIGSPEIVGKFLVGTNRDVQIINVSAEKKFEIIVDVAEEEGNETLAEKFEISSSAISKLKYIIRIANREGPTLLFTNTREMAEALASRLKLLDSNLKIKVHHGSLSKEERIEAEKMFKKGMLNLLVCTSSLELGLDIGTANYVIQYMSPRQVTKMIQRIGRAGHKLWEVSRGLILASNVDDILESAVIARRALEKNLEKTEIYERSLDVLAHQLVGLTMDLRKLDLNYALKVFRRAYPYRNLTINDLEKVASLLAEIKILKFEVNNESKIVKCRRGSWKYYYENLSVIPDIKKFIVIDIASRKPIGSLDEEFIAIHGFKKEPFILAGRTWKTITISEGDCRVYVVQVEDEIGAIPAWIGELIPVPYEIAQEVGELREKLINGSIKAETYPLTSRALNKALKELGEHISCGIPLPTNNRVVIEGLGNIIVIHSCLGTRVNKALAVLLGYELTKRLKTSVRVFSDPYRVLISLPKAIKAHSISKLLMQLCNTMREINEAIKSSEIFKWKLYHVAKRFGILSKEAPLSKINRILRLLEGTPVEEEAINETLHDYFDINRLFNYLEKIRNREVKVEIYDGSIKEGVSTLAYYILNVALPYDLIPPKKALATLTEIMKARLLDKEVLLICVYCGNWHTIRKIKYIPNEIRCPKCGAKAIGAAHPSKTNLIKILKKWKKRRRLSRSEMEEFEKLRKTVGLVMTYGKKAIIALSARGIGPTVAARILRKYHEDEDEFYLDLLEAEKEYLRTRPFWE